MYNESNDPSIAKQGQNIFTFSYCHHDLLCEISHTSVINYVSITLTQVTLKPRNDGDYCQHT